MPKYNAEQRTKLRDELRGLKFNRAKYRLARLDPKGRLVYFRNSQVIGQYHTRYDLEGLGARVILIEHSNMGAPKGREKAQFDFVDVIVEPLEDNPS